MSVLTLGPAIARLSGALSGPLSLVSCQKHQHRRRAFARAQTSRQHQAQTSSVDAPIPLAVLSNLPREGITLPPVLVRLGVACPQLLTRGVKDEVQLVPPEAVTATPLLDRVLHHATAVVTGGESFRMKQARSRSAPRPGRVGAERSESGPLRAPLSRATGPAWVRTLAQQ